ncbi:MAG: hypothetical protein ACJ76F_07785 [Bacteroidia bacterium]
MKLNFTHLFILGAAFVLMTQCKKEKANEPDATPTSGGTTTTDNTLADIFTHQGSQPQTTTIPVTASQNLSVAGVTVSVPVNGFVTATGGSVTGSVDILLKAVLTKKDIILTGAPGNSNGKLIATKGCVKVNATQNGQVLRMVPGSPVHVHVPAGTNPPAQGMKKWYTASVSTTDTSKYWRISADTNNIPLVMDTTTMNYYYDVALDSLSWLNCGYVWDTTSAKTSVTINVDTTFTSANCAVYISLDNTMAVGALYELTPHTYMITNIPIGKTVTFVAIAVINGQYYSKFLPATITANYTQTFNLQSTTLTQIQSALTILP